MAAAVSSPELNEASDTTRARARTRVLLFVGIAGAAAVVLLIEPRVIEGVRDGSLAKEWLALGPSLVLAAFFAALLEVLRSARRRTRYWGRGLIQLGFAGVVFAFVATQSVLEYRTRAAPPASSDALLENLARSRDARVRALVMEVAGHRAPTAETDALLDQGGQDSDPMVRDAAKRARAHRDQK